MSRLWPRSLFGRVALVVCGGLALAHALTFWIILRERGVQGMRMMESYVGRDVAASVAILDRLAPVERAAWLPRLARENYHYSLTPPPPAMPAVHPVAAPIMAAVRRALPPPSVVGMRQQDRGGRVDLLLALRLADGTPLTVHLSPPSPAVSRPTIALLLVQLAALGAAAWWAVRLSVRPLRQLAVAVEGLEPGRPSPAALDEDGPAEVAQAARAFNALQGRIDAHLAERMQLLAAISHDLQTPLTRMRLRADLLADGPLRGRFQEDLAAMESLVNEGLAYARTARAVEEVPRPVDLQAMLDALVCDAVDAGHRVELRAAPLEPVVTRVQALRRIVNNLLDNALKFGGDAIVLLDVALQEVRIRVQDRGPGIPEAELQAVMQPFYRLESSRSRETGGTGLGLAIAQQLAEALPGKLSLRNRPGGGLEACLTLAPHCAGSPAQRA